jgi:hypothetical protein
MKIGFISKHYSAYLEGGGGYPSLGSFEVGTYPSGRNSVYNSISSYENKELLMARGFNTSASRMSLDKIVEKALSTLQENLVCLLLWHWICFRCQ